ncbi:MAG: TIGR03435 family protein [Limisphaerales bacterium]
MPDASDMELLRDYVRQGSEDAFAELVRRHVHLVYSAALRHVGIAAHAEEITQAVFDIFARKAARLRPDAILEAWFYQTTRLASLSFMRGERRRLWREQEAFMQSPLQESGDQAIWEQLAPLLDEAMARLGKTDREAVVLRYFKGKSLNEVAAALKTTEAAAQSRVHRAVGKLQAYFLQRGIDSTTAAITGTISTYSIQAAPVALAKTVSAVALAKGATASTSTLTLIKGALKIMAWSKAKTAIVAGVVLLLAGTTAMVTVKERYSHEYSEWDIGRVDGNILRSAPHIVRIIPSRFPTQGGSAGIGNGRFLGLGLRVEEIAGVAYGDFLGTRTVFSTTLPSGKYDFIANLLWGSNAALRREMEKQFGIVGRNETVETNVLFLQIKSPNAPGLRLTTTRNYSSSRQAGGEYHTVNLQLGSACAFLEVQFGIPVIDQTGLSGSYDINLKWDFQNDPQHENLKQALFQQLGLKLVPGVAPVKMVVIEKAK